MTRLLESFVAELTPPPSFQETPVMSEMQRRRLQSVGYLAPDDDRPEAPTDEIEWPTLPMPSPGE